MIRDYFMVTNSSEFKFNSKDVIILNILKKSYVVHWNQFMPKKINHIFLQYY